MTRFIGLILFAALCAGCGADSPVRVLVYTVSAGYEHEVARRPSENEWCVVERRLAERTAGDTSLEVSISRDSRMFTPARLALYDVVFFYTTGELPLDEAQRTALIDFVKGGGGFAGAHCATDTFYEFPEYGRMIGAWFDGHPWHEEVQVNVEDPGHPATAHLGAQFQITDEIYQFKAPYDRKRLHVLLSLDLKGLDTGKDGVKRTDGDFAVAWTKDFGAGRVFYTSLGHREEVWNDDRFMRHLIAGLRWAGSSD